MTKIISLKKVVKKYEDACNLLAIAINARLFNCSRSFSWTGDEIGDICDFEGTDFLNTQEMAYILKNNITYEEYSEWRNANLEHEKFINIQSWHMGLRHDMLNEKDKTE